MDFLKNIDPLVYVYLGVASFMLPAVVGMATRLTAFYVHNHQPTIREEAYQVLEEEKTELGINSKVGIQISEDDELKRRTHIQAIARHNNEGPVIITNRSDLTRILIRHELYHIARDGGRDEAGNTLEESIYILEREVRNLPSRPLFALMVDWRQWKQAYSEFRADVYALAGLRL